MTMYNTNSPITREERNNINATWQDILSRFAKIQSDIRFLTGNEEVEELIARINSSIDAANEAATNAENATLEVREATEAANNITTEARVLLGDLTVLQNVLEQMQTSLVEAKNNANEAATNANDATQLAHDATATANTAAQEAITATTNANEATQLAQESADNAAQATANAQAATEDANNAAQAANEKVTEATQLLTALEALKDELQQLQTDVTQIATAAETATINANQATENANTAITAANLATEAANTAATNASTATDAAHEATIAATTAAGLASTAASLAEQAATDATAATSAAETATTNANDATTAVNASALSANTAATEANTAKDEVIVKIGEAIVATTDANTAAERADLAADLIEGWEQKQVWNNTTEYVKNNLVTYNGSTWQAKRANTGVTPVSGDDWLLFAQRGVDGTGAVSSVNGVLPDEQGNVELDLETGIVRSVNGIEPDSTGDVELETGIKIEGESRDIYVGATREFTTIQSAIDSIGDIMSPQTTIAIFVDQGVYNENVIIGRTQGGEIYIRCLSSRNRFTINGYIDIRNTSSRVVLNNITLNYSNNDISKNKAISIINSTVVLNSSLVDSFNNNGIETYSANVALTSVTINNSKYAISAGTNSIINAYSVKGTGNTTSYYAHTSSVINYAESNEIELTKETGYGGRIIPFNYNPVTTVNGQSPDASGNITIPISEVPTDYVKTVNGNLPNEDGNMTFDGYSIPVEPLLVNPEGISVSGAIIRTDMRVGTHENIDVPNAQNLTDAVNKTFQFANDGKTVIANAVDAKGVPASPSDTFPTLATKIGQIKSTLTGDANPRDVLAGKTFYSNNPDTKLIGTASYLENELFYPSAQRQYLEDGFYEGCSIQGDANLSPKNIKQGVSIFGVMGTAQGKSYYTTTQTTDPDAKVIQVTVPFSPYVVVITHAANGMLAGVWVNYTTTLNRDLVGTTTITSIGNGNYRIRTVTNFSNASMHIHVYA